MKFNKKSLLAVILAAVLLAAALTATSLLLVGCDNNTPDVDDGNKEPVLKYNPNKITLVIGNTFSCDLEGLQEGETAAKHEVVDEAVATVDANGVITAVGAGSTVVKTTTSLDRMALIQVDVVEDVLELVPIIVVDNTSLNLSIGDKFAINATVYFESKVVEAQLSWTSTDKNVAEVVDGKVNAIAAGKATLVCTAVYQEQSTTALVEVVVSAAPFAYLPDYQGIEIWKGDVVDLVVSQTVNGETTEVSGVTYETSNADIASVANTNGKWTLTAVKGGDVTITASFSHNGQTYTSETKLHVYGTHVVSVYALGYTSASRDNRISNKMYGDLIELKLNKQVEGRSIKCWYVNGQRIEGNTFIMPDQDVTAYAKYVNETEGDFTSTLGECKMLNGTSTASFVKEVFTDSANKTNTDGNYVKLDNLFGTGGAAVEYGFDESVVVSNAASAVLRVFLPNNNAKLVLGVGDTAKATYGATETGKYKVTAGKWIEITVPLNDFVSNGSLLGSMSIGLKGASEMYIDYIMLKY